MYMSFMASHWSVLVLFFHSFGIKEEKIQISTKKNIIAPSTDTYAHICMCVLIVNTTVLRDRIEEYFGWNGTAATAASVHVDDYEQLTQWLCAYEYMITYDS